jgi:hypothetical protein
MAGLVVFAFPPYFISGKASNPILKNSQNNLLLTFVVQIGEIEFYRRASRILDLLESFGRNDINGS